MRQRDIEAHQRAVVNDGNGRESKPVAASQRSATPERQQQQPTTNERLLRNTREATATTYNQ